MVPDAPLLTRRGPLIIEGEVAAAVVSHGSAADATRRFAFRRYGLAAGAAAIVIALAAIVLLAPDVSALPGVALLEGVR
jgi:hypothetical protein